MIFYQYTVLITDMPRYTTLVSVSRSVCHVTISSHTILDALFTLDEKWSPFMKMDASDCGNLVYQDRHSNQSDVIANFFFGKHFFFLKTSIPSKMAQNFRFYDDFF